MAVALKSSTLELLKRFNKSFPKFYEQFVSSDVQLLNLKLAYQVYQTEQAVIEIHPEAGKTSLYFVYRNQSYLPRDIFGVVAAYGLTIHNLSLYGQVTSPMLVFITLVVSEEGKPLSQKTTEELRSAIQQTLAGQLDIDEKLAAEFMPSHGLEQVETEFYIDPVFTLPMLLIEADIQTRFFYKVADAIWNEDLLIVNATLLNWRGRTRMILYLLGPDESAIPDYLGQRIAEGVKRRLSGTIR
jgi:hypothetical protein